MNVVQWLIVPPDWMWLRNFAIFVSLAGYAAWWWRWSKR